MKAENKTNELYAAPMCSEILIQAEGVLCSSGENVMNGIDDYIEETYQW